MTIFHFKHKLEHNLSFTIVSEKQIQNKKHNQSKFSKDVVNVFRKKNNQSLAKINNELW